MIDESDKNAENANAESCAASGAGKDIMRWLEKHFIDLGLQKSAIEWLIMLWSVIQVFDDIADSDPVNRQDLDNAIWYSLVGMHTNSFFQLNHSSLLPVVANAIMKWQASDLVEKSGIVDEKTFVWRSAYYDVVMMAVILCHGHEKAKKLAPFVMKIYGEKYSDYVKEFSNV